jgi:hypothetical protein
MPGWKETELAWLAGFVDGEGCVRIARDKNKAGRSTPYTYYLSVQISQKDPTVLRRIKETWGGTMWCKNPERNGGVWNYHIKARKAQALLEAILPHLVLKREQAEMALAFQERRLSHPGPVQSDRTLDDEDYWALREAKVFKAVA